MARRQESESGINLDLVVEAGDWPKRLVLQRLTCDAIIAATTFANAAIDPGAELTVIFTDDAHIRVLNRRFRSKDKPTNVLSFPAARPPKAKSFGPHLGDIIVSFQTVASEAGEGGLALEDHLTHLIVHGFLHLLGHDHEEDAKAVMMERLETAILANLGIADPYGDR